MRSRKSNTRSTSKRKTLHKKHSIRKMKHKGGGRKMKPKQRKQVSRPKYKTIVLETEKDLKKYSKEMLNKDDWLILYHSHQCPHCVSMIPMWNKLKKSKPTVNILEVESAVFNHIDMQEPVMFIPTIRFLNKKKNIFEEYNGEKTLANLKKFIKSSSLKKTPAKENKEFSIVENKYDRDMLNEGHWVILYHSHHCPHCISMMPEWQRFKEMKPEINILELENELLRSIEPPTEVSGYPTITYYDVNKPPVKFNGERTAEALQKFIRRMLL